MTFDIYDGNRQIIMFMTHEIVFNDINDREIF